MKKRRAFLWLLAAIVAVPAIASLTVSGLNVALPGGGTALFAYVTDSVAGWSWPLVQIWDGVNKMVVVPLGQAASNASIPVVLPAVQVPNDLCTMQRKTKVAISTTAASTQLVGAVALNQVYICSIFIQPTANATISIIEGGSTTCTSPTAMAGSTTPVLALLAANGFVHGDGAGTILQTSVAGDGVCLVQSGTVQLSGYLLEVQSPL